jgi:serine protease AprX
VTKRFFRRHECRATAAVLMLAVTAAPGFAEHRARLSADLADHLATGSPSIDVIVDGDGPTIDAIAARYNLVVKRRMKNGGVLRVNAGQLDALQRDPDLDHLSGDVAIRSSMAVTNVSIGADQIWAGDPSRRSLTGKGVTVAVIDSGIDARHQALTGRVIAAVDFTGGDGADRFGHGTHVAGIIAGQAGRTAGTRQVQGVAAGAYLVSLRVLGDDGSGTMSSVIEAIDWAIDHRKQYDIGVINLSLGAAVLQPYRDDPLCHAVERAVEAGIVVVASAGNLGKTKDGRTQFGGITSPGNDPYVLTVGAIDTHGTPVRSDDTVATYSSRGPTRFDLAIKPDVVAPGTHIVSAEATGSYLSKTFPERHVTGTGPSAYLELSGTSMGGGVVSGTVALLLQGDHRLKPWDVKAIVQLTSALLPEAGLLTAGTGSVNALAAVLHVQRPSTNSVMTNIGSEQVAPSGMFFAPVGQNVKPSQRNSPSVESQTPLHGHSDRIVWRQMETIVWGQTDTIVWGQSDTIVWGQTDTIVWGQNDTIVWGQTDTIVWGQ